MTALLVIDITVVDFVGFRRQIEVRESSDKVSSTWCSIYRDEFLVRFTTDVSILSKPGQSPLRES